MDDENSFGDEVHLVRDAKGIAIIGSQQAVERFVAAEGAPTRAVDMPRLSKILAAGSGTAEASAHIAAEHGRWIKLTKASAEKLATSTPMKGSTAEVSRAIVTDKGKISGILEFSTQHGDVLANPAVLTGAAGVMAQLAMQQAMDEITDYLKAIDAKVDDILRAQKDAVLADMIAAGDLLDEAMAVRESVGRVSEVTWSKVQGVGFTISRTQIYALRQLDAVAERLEGQRDVGDLATITREAEDISREWFAVLARCFQLLDAIAVLELDRVLDASPDEIDTHRRGLETARDNRARAIAERTRLLMSRIDDAAGTANSKVLTNPRSSAKVVRSRNTVASQIVGFHDVLGLTQDGTDIDARAWGAAATDLRDRAVERGAEKVDAAKRFGADRLTRAKTAKDKVSDRLPEVSVSIRRKQGSEND